MGNGARAKDRVASLTMREQNRGSNPNGSCTWLRLRVLVIRYAISMNALVDL